MSNNIQEQAIDAANPVLDAMGEVAAVAGRTDAEPSLGFDSLSELEKQGEVLDGMFGTDEVAFNAGEHKIQFTRSAGGDAIKARQKFVREENDEDHLAWLNAGLIHAAALRQVYVPVGCEMREEDTAYAIINALPSMNKPNVRGEPRYPTIEGVKSWTGDVAIIGESGEGLSDVIENLLTKVAGEDRRLRELVGHNETWNGLRRVFVEKVELDALLDNLPESKTYQFLDFVGLDYQMRHYEHTFGIKPRVFLIMNDAEKRIAGALFLGATSALEITFKKPAAIGQA